MQIAARVGRLLRTATFSFIVTLGSLWPPATLAQEAQPAEEMGASRQIQVLVADLKERGAVLDELQRKVGDDSKGAAAAMLEKEVSDRRARYRRDVAKLVQLVVSAEDAGAKAAQGRSMASQVSARRRARNARKAGTDGERGCRAGRRSNERQPRGSAKGAQRAQPETLDFKPPDQVLDTNIDQQKCWASM